jgi:hypothetical protein
MFVAWIGLTIVSIVRSTHKGFPLWLLILFDVSTSVTLLADFMGRRVVASDKSITG